MSALIALGVMVLGGFGASYAAAERGHHFPSEAFESSEEVTFHADSRNNVVLYVDESSARERVYCAASSASGESIALKDSRGGTPMVMTSEDASSDGNHVTTRERRIYPKVYTFTPAHSGEVTVSCELGNPQGGFKLDNSGMATSEFSAPLLAGLATGTILGVAGLVAAVVPTRRR
ncbi:hypothetical protein [Leifsonia sp. C5G2]|uniref:hypothetical protein n=1 Tax=Leifsonia sp. C5G2 TaxID=2735269 RepID=UPI001584E7A8|nr:hypothetical protein [Leifsonia sp. C5G2]NUU06092.1 hypothetical protein [Leifsonia sp. C5G2]